MVKTIVFVIIIRLHHIPMVKTIVFVIILIILSFFAPEVYRTNTKPVHVWTPSGPKITDPVSVTLPTFQGHRPIFVPKTRNFKSI